MSNIVYSNYKASIINSMTKTLRNIRNVVQKLGHLQVIILITVVAIIFSELFAYLIIKIFSFPYPFPSTPIVTLLVTAILTPFISWHLLELLFSIDALEQKMNYLATYDPMTKLLSRQAFFQRSLNLIDTSLKKSHKSYTVSIIDIDNFKSINDSYGHAYGDKILIHFGSLISKVLDTHYIIGRIGGEEFAILSNIDIKIMKEVMDKLHQSIVKSKILYQNNPITYTISIGIFENKKPNILTFDEALSYADHALYYAKVTGKNKSIIFSETLLNNNSLRKTSNLRSRTS